MAADFQVGDFLVETLVTDTRAYEVIAKTAKTLRLRPCGIGKAVKRENRDGNPWPCVWSAITRWPTDECDRTVRLRKDGTYRSANWGKPLRHAPLIDGVPCTFTDYRE